MQLRPDRFSVGGKGIGCLRRTLPVPSGRVADRARRAADEHDDPMTVPAEMQEADDGGKVAEMQGRGRGIDAEIDGPRALQVLSQAAAGHLSEQTAVAKCVERI